eukprot:TRINITY_DN8447_c0_g1_i2.p2 TRINITY_DN8447_c0_g1~~TRINITY_DN8447_c0_g1_i2.p2  ORF type:complete len:363 (+),score=95.32 TRINITY_DN8447_c0_g1_i2:293-1381(+)
MGGGLLAVGGGGGAGGGLGDMVEDALDGMSGFFSRGAVHDGSSGATMTMMTVSDPTSAPSSANHHERSPRTPSTSEQQPLLSSPTASSASLKRSPSTPTTAPGEAVNVFTRPEDPPPSTAVYMIYDDPGERLNRDGLQVVEQLDVYKHVFVSLHEERNLSGNGTSSGTSSGSKYFNSVFMEYVRSLAAQGIPLQEFMHRFLIDLCIYAVPPDYHRLHEYLQYHVVEDQETIALQLLKFTDLYPPAFQLALDMLSRLRKYSAIADVLFAKDHLIRAVELMIQYKLKTITPEMVLDRAMQLDDDQLFFACFQLLQKYNFLRRGQSEFLPEDRCERFVQKYNALLEYFESAPPPQLVARTPTRKE